MPKGIVEILFQFGPVALLVFFVYVIEKRARGLLGALKPRWLPVTLYTACWISIFCLCAIATWVWIELNVPKPEATVHGEFKGISRHAEIVSANEHLFLRRRYSKEGPADYEWRLVSRGRLPIGATLEFDLSRADVRSPDGTTILPEPEHYQVVIEDTFYAHPVVCEYRSPGRMLLKVGGTEKELRDRPQVASIDEERARSGPWSGATLLPAVLAQSSEALASILLSLESSDPILRRIARRSLAEKGTEALPTIDRFLTQPTSYQQQLGALVALSLMGGHEAQGLSDAAHAGLQRLTRSADVVLRRQAIRVLVKDPRQLPHGTSKPQTVSTKQRENRDVLVRVGGDEFKFSFVVQPVSPGQIQLELSNFGQPKRALENVLWAFASFVDGQIDRTIEVDTDPSSPLGGASEASTIASVHGPEATLLVVAVAVPSGGS